MTQLVRIVAGDSVSTGDHVITLSEGGAVFDLTGVTGVKWKTRLRSSATVDERAMTVVGLDTAGKVTMTYTAVETAALGIGEHLAQVEVTQGEDVRTFPGPGQEQIVMVVSEGL